MKKPTHRKRTFCERQFLRMLIPGTISYAAIILQEIADVIIGGRFLGEAALEGISIMAPVINIGAFAASLLSHGTALLYNHEMGKFDNEEASKVFSNSLVINIAISVLEAIVFTLFADSIIGFYNTSAEVSYYAGEYFRWYRYTICLLPIYELLENMVFADGDSFVSGLVSSFVLIFGVILSVLMASVYGVRGIGMASFITHIFAVLLLSTHFFKKSNSIRFIWHLSLKDTLGAAYISIPHALSYLFDAVAKVCLNGLMIANYGEDGLIAISCVMAVISFMDIFCGVSKAVGPAIGIYEGEGNQSGKIMVMKIAENYSVAEGVIFTVAVLVFAPLIPPLMGITTDTAVSLCVHAVRIIVFCAVFESLSFLFETYFTETMHIGMCVFLEALSSLCFTAGLSLLLSGIFGLDGIWISIMLSRMLSLAVISTFIVFRFGKENYPYLCSKENDCKIFNCLLTAENIEKMMDEVEKVLPASYSNTLKNRIMLAIEESGHLILEKNHGKKTAVEYDIFLNDDPEMIVRFDGKLYNPMEDKSPDSMREFVFSCIHVDAESKTYQVSASQNRMKIKFRKHE